MGSLDKVKAGDSLATYGGGFYNQLQRLTVKAVHKLHVVTTDGRKWAKSHGWQAGKREGWHRASVEPWTANHDERLEAQRRDDAHRRRCIALRELIWREQPHDLVEKVHALVFEPCDEERAAEARPAPPAERAAGEREGAKS